MERRPYGRDALNTPSNWQSAFRLLSAPIQWYLINRTEGKPSLAAFATHVGGGLIDIDDGRRARKDGTTRFGELLDPFADKVFITTEQFALAKNGEYPYAALAMIATREFGIMAYRAWLDHQGIALPARPFGKAKMAAQIVDVGARLLPQAEKYNRSKKVLTAATVALTVISGIDLIIAGERKRRQKTGKVSHLLQYLHENH